LSKRLRLLVDHNVEMVDSIAYYCGLELGRSLQ